MTKSEGSESVTVRLPADIAAEIEAIAGATGGSRNRVIVRALKVYLLNEGADVLSAIRGRDQIAAGDYEDIDDVIADLDRIVTRQSTGCG